MIVRPFVIRKKGIAALDSMSPSHKGFRYPAEIISHGVWLYFRFPLSFREVEELLLARGITVSHETVRQWCAKFRQTYANAPAPAPAPPRGHLAPGRGLHQDQWEDALPVAGR